MAEPSRLGLLNRLPDEVLLRVLQRTDPIAVQRMTALDETRLGKAPSESVKSLAHEVFEGFSQEIANASARNMRFYERLRIHYEGISLSYLVILKEQIHDLRAHAQELNLDNHVTGLINSEEEVFIWVSQHFRELLVRINDESEYTSFKSFTQAVLRELNTANPKVVLPTEEGLTLEVYREVSWKLLKPYLENIIKLKLSCSRLTQVSENLEDLIKLTELDLAGNYLRSLPDGISALTGLRRLCLDCNSLTSLPNGISALTALQGRFSLGRNSLTSLPDGISALTGIKDFALHNNSLTNLPEGISALTGLSSLDLRDNQLTSLPEKISALTGLTGLSVDRNQLTELPNGISALIGLQVLSLSRNRLTSLPDALSALIRLQELSISDNQITTKPQVIASLPQLKRLFWES